VRDDLEKTYAAPGIVDSLVLVAVEEGLGRKQVLVTRPGANTGLEDIDYSCKEVEIHGQVRVEQLVGN
jgi:hypothetical protein